MKLATAWCTNHCNAYNKIQFINSVSSVDKNLVMLRATDINKSLWVTTAVLFFMRMVSNGNKLFNSFTQNL